MAPAVLWAFVIRAAQALVEASPTLLCGLVAAGVLRRMLGPTGTRRLFGGTGSTRLLKAWGIGMLLPVCSIGVIPVVREMRRAGVPAGTVLTFALIAPLLNPMSFLYGLTLADPLVICCFAGASLAVALVAGGIQQRFPIEIQEPATASEDLPRPGIRRLLAVIVTAAHELNGPTLRYALVAVAMTGVLSAVLPFGMLQPYLRHNDPWSPVLMAGVVTPAYMGPLPGMMRIGLMFEHGNSVGAAFVLLVLGVGVNAGVVVWALRAYGPRPTLIWFGAVIVSTVALAYAMERPLYRAAEEAGHTHAFDDLSSPFPTGQYFAGAADAWPKIARKLEILEPVALVLLVALSLLGMGLRAVNPRLNVENFLTGSRTGDLQAARPWDQPLPAPVLGAATLLGLVVFGAVSAYVYYPAPRAVFDEMGLVRTETESALLLGHREEAIRRIAEWDLLTRKLQVGIFLRTGRLDPAASQQADDFRETLEQARDILLAGRVDEARTLLDKIEKDYRSCRQSYDAFLKQ